MEVIKTQKPITWPDRLKAMDIGQILKTDARYSATVRQAASRALPNEGYEMKFTTKTVVEGRKRFITIQRTA